MISILEYVVRIIKNIQLRIQNKLSTQPAVRFAITKLPSQAPHSSTEVYFAPNRRYICIYTYIFKIETFIFLFVFSFSLKDAITQKAKA